jgi:hypothetical protein
VSAGALALGSLGGNGGSTETHALLAGSAALDGGENGACPAVDQRGEARPEDGDGDGLALCDVGAFEAQAGVGPGPGPAPGGCQPNATTLCLGGGRFRVTSQWLTPSPEQGQGQAVALTDATGFFWFFTADNIEMVVKLLNGCAINNRFWIFAGGLTDVEVRLRVEDTQTGAVKTYLNPQSAPFQPIQDTGAFATCP